MPNQTYNDFFSGQRMTLLAGAAAIKPNVPRVLPDVFYTPGPTKPYNDQVQFPSVTWSRAGARITNRNSPPFAVSLGQTDWKFVTIFNMKEEMEIAPDFMATLFSDFPMVRNNAMMELNNRMIQFNQRFDITRTQMVHSLFANGKIWVGSDGQVLASSSGAVITMDPGIPTGNKITKDGSGSTYNIGDFSNVATDIRAKLAGLQVYNVQQNGYVLKTLVYGNAMPGYLAVNTTLAPYFQRNQGFRDTLVATNDIPNGLLGYNWIPARLAYAVSNSGTVTQTFADNFLAAMPDVDPSWYEFIEGGTQVPNGIAGATQVQPNATAQSMLNQFSIVNGKYAFGVVKSYPVTGTSMVQGDCAGPVVKVPGVLYFGTVS